MEAKASARNMRGSAQKARLVVDLIRGKNVAHALAILQFTNKRAAGVISKCLKSAIANANFAAEKQNIAIDPDDLWVKACFVDVGPTKRRFRMRPAPQGRAYRERRHYCHITVEVTSEKPAVEVEKENKSKAAKEATAKKPKVEKKAAAPKKEAKEAKETKAAPKAKKAEVESSEDILDIPAAEASETAAVETEVKAAETEAVEAKGETNVADEAEVQNEAKTESTTTEADTEGDKKE